MTRVLGIDPGSRKGLGWAVLETVDSVLVEGLSTVRKVASGVVKVTGIVEGSMDRTPVWAAIFDVMGNWLWRAEENECVDAVAYEQVMRHSSVWAAHLYGGQQAMIQWWAHTMDRPTIPVAVQTVKRMLGCRASGGAKAVAMVQAAQRLGYDVSDHNEADAVGIALGGLEWMAKHPK